MKNIVLILLAFSGTASAQQPSCCTMPVNEQNHLLAMNEEFAKTHENPLPFKLQTEKGRIVAFKTPVGNNGRAYVVKSDKPTDKVLFLFHEWWGLNDYIKQEAEKWRDELGDVDVYALDLYDGAVATTREDAQKLMGKMSDERSRAIIQGAIDLVGSHAKIATIGWCMGGAWSMQGALLAGDHAKACVMYYGMPETDVKKIKTLNCDILGIFGTQDKFINPDVVKKFEENMKEAGKKLKVHNYDADHAFANPSNPKYNPKFTEEAHGKALAYLKERLH